MILMGCLWAHSQGDKLAAATPRGLTLKSLPENRLSAEFTERIDSYGQVRIRPTGEIRDIEGYPPLPESARRKATGSELDDRQATMLAGDTTLEEFDRLRERWRTMGRAVIGQMHREEYRYRETVPFYLTAGHVS